ncbi:hypothetical protein FGO68_gene9333 [Halteria grandinella]|uniref:Uncharacterized protein n=1 Tax=Halteria grandinella TaxID=5974 RepID=A0A8J8N9Y1_HALGN|nr:hypothetical protein FGO68_gene9333 [Halteria grandinella]
MPKRFGSIKVNESFDEIDRGVQGEKDSICNIVSNFINIMHNDSSDEEKQSGGIGKRFFIQLLENERMVTILMEVVLHKN